jgi:multidrug resistance efflux pump
MEKAHRGVLRQCWDVSDQVARNCLKPGTWGRRALAAALVALVLWTVLGTKSYIISVPCEVVPAEKRHIAAPFEGTIAAAHVKLGEHIGAGQLLVELDTSELQTQQDKLFAELAIAELELTHAAQKKDVSAAALARSRADVARAELAIVQHRIEQARICAPEDGVVLAGDLLPRVGEVVPLGEPLLEVAPGNRWSVELHIPESVAVYLATGQQGEFTTYALPDQVQPCRLARICPSTEVVNGKTVFTAEASLPDCPPPWIRAGMQGMAHIDAGKHAVWWVWMHRAIDSVRLQLWKL